MYCKSDSIQKNSHLLGRTASLHAMLAIYWLPVVLQCSTMKRRRLVVVTHGNSYARRRGTMDARLALDEVEGTAFYVKQNGKKY
ncbi:hypothetical protein ANCCAN_15223 [Ancylostoma caninum]|uniref:Uncharacterized protein n=1 Tax=Ancylostoma caninum TaxID=29170 RepID=A0A368G5C7_ANCCA|nr:hypothetical protein ANCCAN_15223 [Ancylostoma caninum]